MTDDHIVKEVADTVWRRLEAGEYSIDQLTSKGISETIGRWLRNSAAIGEGHKRNISDVVKDLQGDELLSHRLHELTEGMLGRIVVELIDEELERRFANGDLEKRISADGELDYFEPE